MIVMTLRRLSQYSSCVLSLAQRDYLVGAELTYLSINSDSNDVGAHQDKPEYQPKSPSREVCVPILEYQLQGNQI